MGISEEDQTKLFNAFNQADSSISRRFGGTGLGLVICKKLVEAMEGTITLSSELQKGTTFTVNIKLQKLMAYEGEKHQVPRFQQIKALVFDENPLQLEATLNALNYLGVSCISASDLKALKRAF